MKDACSLKQTRTRIIERTDCSELQSQSYKSHILFESSQGLMAILPPSVQLLRALRSMELLQTSLHTSQRRLHLCQSKLTTRPSAYCSILPSRPLSQLRHLSQTTHRHAARPRTTDRGPPSQEDTQTDFGALNVLGNMPAPTTSIDACLSDGFHLDNGLKIGGGSGCLLVAGEAFSWRPWEAFGSGGDDRKRRMLNEKGQWDVQKEVWGLLDLVWPKPGMYPTPSRCPLRFTTPSRGLM